MTENCDPLDLLLAAFEEVEQADKSPKKTLNEINIFEQETNIPKTSFNSTATKGLIHSGDTDSSDDEGNRHWEERKYSENGRDIKRLLDTPSSSSTKIGSIGTDTKRVSHLSTWKDLPKSITDNTKVLNKLNPKKSFAKPPDLGVKSDVYTDPIFCLRIINPLISSTVLKDRMMGRQAVNFMGLKRFLQIKTQDKDWVIAGVIVGKTAQKTSQKGNKFSLWTLSDLKDDIKTISLFLFAGANAKLWKTAVGTVVGVLNPDVLEKRSDNSEATLSINNADKVMILGQSKDFGTCKSVKKNGDKCTAVVNVNRCEFCIYHIKQEYQKCSIRSDLQSTFGGRGLTALRNKVLGKNEVFYAGKSYMAIPAKRSKKLEQQDNNRLNLLSGKASTTSKNIFNSVKKKSASTLDASHGQRMKDIRMLEKLNGVSDLTEKTHFEGKQSAEITLEDAKSLAASVLSKLKAKQQNVPVEPSESSSRDSIQSKSPKSSSKPDTPPFKATDNTSTSPGTSRGSIKTNGTTSKCVTTPGTSSGSSNPDTPVSKATGDILENSGTSKSSFKPVTTELNSPKLGATSSKATDNILMSPGTSIKPNTTTSNLPGLSSVSIKPNTISLDYQSPFSGPKYAFPKLSGFDSGLVDLNKPITPTRKDRAKQNAIKLIQKVGPIQKSDPNNLKGTGAAKRRFGGLEGDPEAKRFKAEPSSFSSERYKKIMAAASSHQDLIEARDDEEKEKYFKKLEAKENMEEKMIGTHKLACKAVRCLQCKYVSFSASELCKSERHPLKVFDAMKRFFKCGNCQHRTVCLEVVPLNACNNCGGSKWEKTGMMKEKLVRAAHGLSIRGGEQKHLNSVVTDASLDLLVPD